MCIRDRVIGWGGASSPGSISSRRRPVGRVGSPADSDGSALTRTSTPSESPTHSGAVAPRTRPEARSAVPGSAPCSALWVSTSCQPDQAPVAVARVRTWTRPWSSVSGLSQTTPTSEKRRTSLGGRPCSGAAGVALFRFSGARGKDSVWPGAGLSPALVAASAVGAGLVFAATADGVSGSMRAAAQVTPIEEASNPRMPLMLDIVIQICPLGS